MYKSLSATPLDLYPASIPILTGPPTGGIVIEDIHRPFQYGERVKSIIASYASANVVSSINWKNTYLVKFPETIAAAPGTFFGKNGLCVSHDLSSAKFSVDTGQITIPELPDFAACVYYSLTKAFFYRLEDEQFLSDLYHSMTSFIYSFLMRLFMRDYDVINMEDQTLAIIYFIIAKLTINQFLNFSGNTDAVAINAVIEFFTDKDRKYSAARINPNRFPKKETFNSYNDVIGYLNDSGIMPDITLDMFRERIINFASLTSVIGMSNGLDCAAMLVASQISSSVFSRRIISVNPKSVNRASRVMTSFVSAEEEKTETVYGGVSQFGQYKPLPRLYKPYPKLY